MADVSNTLNSKAKSYNKYRSKSPKKQSTRTKATPPTPSDLEDTRILPPPTTSRPKFSSVPLPSDDHSSTSLNHSINKGASSEMTHRLSSLAVAAATGSTHGSQNAPPPTALQISKKFKKQSRSTKSTKYTKNANGAVDSLKDPVFQPLQEQEQHQQHPCYESHTIDPNLAASCPSNSTTKGPSSVKNSTFQSLNPSIAESSAVTTRTSTTEESDIIVKMERKSQQDPPFLKKGHRRKNHSNTNSWKKKKGLHVRALSVEGKRIDVSAMNAENEDATCATAGNSISPSSVILLQHSTAAVEKDGVDVDSKVASVATNETILDKNKDKSKIKGSNKVHITGRKKHNGGKKRPSKRPPSKKNATAVNDLNQAMVTSDIVQSFKDTTCEGNQESDSSVGDIKNTVHSSRPSQVRTNAAGQALLNRLNCSGINDISSSTNHDGELDESRLTKIELDETYNAQVYDNIGTKKVNETFPAQDAAHMNSRTSIPSKIDLEDASVVNSSMMGGAEGSQGAECEYQHPISGLNHPPEIYRQQYEPPQTQQQQQPWSATAQIDMSYNPNMMYPEYLPPPPPFMNIPNGLPYSIDPSQQYAATQPFVPYQQYYPSHGNMMTYVNSIQHPMAPQPLRYEQVTVNGTVFFNAVYSESDNNNDMRIDEQAGQKSDNNNKKEKQRHRKKANKKLKKKQHKKQNNQRQKEEQKVEASKED